MHVNAVHDDRSSSSKASSSRGSTSPVRMGSSPLSNADSLRKTVVSTAAALLIAFSPAVAPCQQAFAAERAGAQELSPAEMLVKKTTDMQVSRRFHGLAICAHAHAHTHTQR